MMHPSVTAALRAGLRQLEAECQRIDRQIVAIHAILDQSGQRTNPAMPTARLQAKARRPRMRAAARKAVSQRMKAYWANRRGEKVKGKA